MKMKLEEMMERVEYLPAERTNFTRNEYINRFINTKGEHYIKFIDTVNEYSDGCCYTGYLWDCLLNPTIITFDEISNYRTQLKNVMVFWDIHSKERIWVDDYWKFGKASILRLDYGDFLDNLQYFPEDVYIFDDSMEWTLVLTHEDNEGIRVCAKAGKI
jgi:hypothetical protein